MVTIKGGIKMGKSATEKDKLKMYDALKQSMGLNSSEFEKKLEKSRVPAEK